MKCILTLSPLCRSVLFMAAGRAVESIKMDMKEHFMIHIHLFADSLGTKYLNKMSKYAVSYIKFRALFVDNHITNIINKFNDQIRNRNSWR